MPKVLTCYVVILHVVFFFSDFEIVGLLFDLALWLLFYSLAMPKGKQTSDSSYFRLIYGEFHVRQHLSVSVLLSLCPSDCQFGFARKMPAS